MATEAKTFPTTQAMEGKVPPVKSWVRLTLHRESSEPTSHGYPTVEAAVEGLERELLNTPIHHAAFDHVVAVMQPDGSSTMAVTHLGDFV